MIVGFVVLLVVAAGRAARWRLAWRHPVPGGLVDVGGHRLHVQRSGTGPTVVFDAGAGGVSDDWALVRVGWRGPRRTTGPGSAGVSQVPHLGPSVPT